MEEMTGSPPRVREKRIWKRQEQLRKGITPACAGKTSKNDLVPSRTWDHPRVCGKNAIAHAKREQIEGSPPRVREKLVEL